MLPDNFNWWKKPKALITYADPKDFIDKMLFSVDKIDVIL